MRAPPSRTILMIDDNPEHLQMQSWIMSQAGFRVVTVIVGQNSFSLPEQYQPGLIFLDHRLNSSLTCPQIAGLLRQTFPGVTIILISSATAMPEEMRYLVDGFISKTDPEQLVRFSRNFFDGEARVAAAAPSAG